jgi:hypothetical protein
MIRLNAALIAAILAFAVVSHGDRAIAALYALDATGVLPLWQVAVAGILAALALAWRPKLVLESVVALGLGGLLLTLAA